jgi:hypothetical protein
MAPWEQYTYGTEVKSAYLDRRGELQWEVHLKPDLTLGFTAGLRRMRKWLREIRNRLLVATCLHLQPLITVTPPEMSPMRIAAADYLLQQVRRQVGRIRVHRAKYLNWPMFVGLVDAFNGLAAQVAIVLAGLLKARGDWTRGEGFE